MSMTTFAWPPAPIPTTGIISDELTDEHERFGIRDADSGAADASECANGGGAPGQRVSVHLTLVESHDRQFLLELRGDVAEYRREKGALTGRRGSLCRRENLEAQHALHTETSHVRGPQDRHRCHKQRL